MTVPAQATLFNESVANGVTTSFPYQFMIASADDLAVELDGVATTTGFTVMGVGDANGGNVVFLIAPANGVKVLLYLDSKLNRTEDYQQFGDFNAETVNREFNRLWLAMQSIALKLGRCVRAPISSAPGVLPDPAANNVIGWNDDGTGFKNFAPVDNTLLAVALASSSEGNGAELIEYKSTTVEAALDARLPEIGTYALLRAYAGPVAAFYVRGVANIFDGGFGVFRVDASDTTSADNGGTVLIDASGRRWKRSFSGSYNVLWFGADRSGVTSSQSAYDLAKGSGNRSIYFPSGTYKVTNLSLPTYTRLHGDGYDSIIQSDGSLNHVITLSYVYHCRIDNLRIKGNAGRTNLCGIYGDGAVWTELENLIVENNGSHGIQFTDTGTPYIGSYPVMARNIHSRSNLGDGYKQVATSGSNQQNAIHISNSEFQGNAGNGLTLWGVNMSVVDSISEGNTGYGIKFDNGLSSGSAYSAANIEVRGNYFEANAAGHIHARVGTYGAILGLGIEGNYISVNTGVVGVGYKAVSVDNYSSGSNLIRNLKYRKNVEGIVGSQPTVYADFGGALNIASVVEPYYSSISTTDITTVPSRYINLGYATFDYVKSITLPGYWLAKGGSGFTYSGSTKSDAVTVDLSNTYFPLQVPIGSRLLYVSIPVESTVASYTVQMYIYQRSRDSTAGHVLAMAGSGTGALNQTVSTAVLQSYTASEDLIDVDNCDMMLRVRVSFSGGGTFYFGNPTVFYVGP